MYPTNETAPDDPIDSLPSAQSVSSRPTNQMEPTQDTSSTKQVSFDIPNSENKLSEPLNI